MSLHVLRSPCTYVDSNDPTNRAWTKKESNKALYSRNNTDGDVDETVVAHGHQKVLIPLIYVHEL